MTGHTGSRWPDQSGKLYDSIQSGDVIMSPIP